MSITIINTPTAIYPAYSINGNPVIASSTLTGDTNLKFVFDLFVENPSTGRGTGSYTKVNRQKIWTNPVDFYGHYNPNPILRTYTTPSANPFIIDEYSNTTGIIFYKITYGEEFTTLQNFTSTQNTFGFLQLNFTTLTSVSAGDEISVKLNNNVYNPQYNNTWTATSVGANTIVLNCPYGTAPAVPETGYIDKILHLQSSLTGLSVWCGTKDYLSASTNFVTTFLMNSGNPNSKFLTSYNGEYRIGTNEPATLSFIESGNTLTKVRYNTYNSVGGQIGNFMVGLNSTAMSQRKDIPTGTWNLSHMLATNTITLGFELIYVPSVAYYTVGLISGSTNLVSELKTYRVSDNSTRFCKVRFVFMNKQGGEEYLSATMKQRYGQKIKRETFDKVLPWNYAVGDRSRTVINVDVDETYTVYTDWMLLSENTLVKELFNSSDVFILDIDNQQKIPVVITNTEYPEKNPTNDRLFNYKITYTMAHDIITQFN
jgi:hypothetical protein